MIELLILHQLSKKTMTMYGIFKEIRNNFSVLLLPSYGTIKPALRRLEQTQCIKFQKSMTKGGRPSTYYYITEVGKKELENLLLSDLVENPVQFLTTARVRLLCADVLEINLQKQMFNILKQKSEEIIFDTNNLLKNNNNDFYKNVVYNNLICEYKNFILVLDNLNKG